MRGKSTITKDQRKKITELLEANVTPSVIANNVGCDVKVVDGIKFRMKKKGKELKNLRGVHLRAVERPGSASATFEALTGHLPSNEPHAVLKRNDGFEISIGGVPVEINSKPVRVEVNEKSLTIFYADQYVTISY